MELKEAVKVTRTLADQFAGLAKVADALALLEGGDKKLEGLLAQKVALEGVIATRKGELQAMDLKLTQEHDQKKAAMKAELDGVAVSLAAAKKALESVQREHAAMIERGRSAQKEITAGLLEERKTQLAALDQQIAKKTASLTAISGELSKLRERVGA